MILVPAISFGMPEMLVVAFIVLVLFGAGKLPSVFKQLGSGIKEFKDAQKDDGPLDVTPTPKALSSDPVRDADEVKDRARSSEDWRE